MFCFLVDLLDHFGDRPAMLFWDGARIHRAGEIADFLARPDLRKRLEVHRLPDYAPELNPEELLNALPKAHALANRSPETLSELQRQAQDHLKKVKQTPGLAASFPTSHRHELVTGRDLVNLSFRGHQGGGLNILAETSAKMPALYLVGRVPSSLMNQLSPCFSTVKRTLTNIAPCDP